MNYKPRIRDFVISDFLFGDGTSLKDDTSFLENGIIDSTGILELITFLEGAFNVKVEPEEVMPENFDSVNQIALFVERKLAVHQPASALQ